MSEDRLALILSGFIAGALVSRWFGVEAWALGVALGCALLGWWISRPPAQQRRNP